MRHTLDFRVRVKVGSKYELLAGFTTEVAARAYAMLNFKLNPVLASQKVEVFKGAKMLERRDKQH